MVNSSKIKDQRFWKRWRASGAVNTPYNNLKQQLENLTTLEERKNVLSQLYGRLLQGEAYDWGRDLFLLEKIFSANDLKKEGYELGMLSNSVANEDQVRQYDRFAAQMPDYFARQIERGAMLSKEEMKQLSSASKEVVFGRLFNHATAYGLGILPGYDSPAIHELDDELLHAFQSWEKVEEKDLPALRKSLGKRAEMIELRKIGKDFYTQRKRESKSAMQTGELEYKIANITPVEGPRFLATHVAGYYGILRYFLEEVARIAPEGANAYLDGTGIIRTVQANGLWSPIMAGNVLRPVNQEKGEYHIVPLKFFKVEVDTSQKYEGNWNVLERDSEDNATYMRYEVKPVA